MNKNPEEIVDDIDQEDEDIETCVDCEGKSLASGDEVSVIKDLKVGGTKLTIKKGTVIKNIKLTGDVEEIECRYDDMKGIILRTEFLRKRS
jgi:protein PhnA